MKKYEIIIEKLAKNFITKLPKHEKERVLKSLFHLFIDLYIY